MAGLFPAIHVTRSDGGVQCRDEFATIGVDGRDKPGHDDIMAIRITDDISIDEREIEESFVRSSGPGGQNVNKLSTAVQLRFDVRGSRSLPNDVAIRLMRLAGKRVTKDGVLVLVAQGSRSQEMNRQEALDRLLTLIRKAAEPPPPPRKKTKPTYASKLRRLDGKTKRASVKTLRGRPRGDD
jgi:ribosome-associated protein